MAEGRPLKRNSYMANEGGSRADIEMPPIDQQTVMNSAPNPWGNEFQASQDQPALAPVPDELPDDVQQEMESDMDVDDSGEQPEQQEPVDRPAPKENSSRDNLVKMRLAREKAERERDELLQMLKYQMNNVNPSKQEPEPEEDYGIGNEDLAEGKHIRKVSKELSDIKKQLAAYKQQSQQDIVEAKIKMQFPDFANVVSEQNVAYLKEEHPEIAQMLIDTSDTYTKAASAYKVIKQFGIYKETPMSRDKVQALKNVAKPKPMAAINPQQGDTPLSKANAFAQGSLTEEMKSQLRKEMMQARRGM